MPVNMNLSKTQINALEEILSDESSKLDMKYTMYLFVDNRTLNAFLRNGIVDYDDQEGSYTVTQHGVQSYCATILTKYDGPTHERIHEALNNYQRLFNS